MPAVGVGSVTGAEVARWWRRPSHRVGAVLEVPGAFEDHGDDQHAEECRLLVAADEAVTEPRLGEGEDTQRQPVGTAQGAVGVAAAPEIEGTPAASGQKGNRVGPETFPVRQMRSDAAESDLHPWLIRIALDYAAEHSAQIRERIDRNRATAERSRHTARQRAALLA